MCSLIFYSFIQMLSDSNREIRQAADSALSDFLREVSISTVMEFGPMVSILVAQCGSKERLNRLTAVTWLAELIHHPYSGGDALLPYHAQVLGAIMGGISDKEVEIRLVAERTNNDLLTLVRDTTGDFELKPLLDTLSSELLTKEDVRTKMAALKWINMLMEKRKADMTEHIPSLLPVLLRTLSDPSDPVVLLNLQVLSRISLAQREGMEGAKESEKEEAQFQLVLNAILNLFAADRNLLETRGSLIVRKLCVLLNAKSVYIRMAKALCKYEISRDGREEGDPEVTEADRLEFIGTMVQTLNLILLTASELSDLRAMLATAFTKLSGGRQGDSDGVKVFEELFRCWCHNPISTFSLCLLAQAYDLAFELIKRFSEAEVTVGFLMQVDKLVQLLESPIYVHLRIQLLDVDSPKHAALLKSLYGLLMLTPQSDAFRSLNDRLTTVCNLRENLGISPNVPMDLPIDAAALDKNELDPEELLKRFDRVMQQYQTAKEELDRIDIDVLNPVSPSDKKQVTGSAALPGKPANNGGTLTSRTPLMAAATRRIHASPTARGQKNVTSSPANDN
jgi:vacuole morphology and inheritance protein 14